MKIERDMSHANFANACEWRNYMNCREWEDFSKWLAPCHGINETGTFLIQTRLTHTSDKIKDFPQKIPNIFTDRKIQNFGWIKDQFVCCDYPYLLLGKKYDLQNVKWWKAK